MKFFYCFFAFFIFASCGSKNEQDSHDDSEIEVQSNQETPSSEDDEEETVTKYVLSVEVGMYGEQAIFNINSHGSDINGIASVEGYYYYIKQGKHIEISGEHDVNDDHFLLTESYQGETTGYMEFDLDAPDECYWSPASDSQDEQDLVVQLLDQGNPYELTVELNDMKFTNWLDVQVYMGEEEGWVEETSENDLYVTIFNDQYMLFDINVVGNNAHIGVANGTAKITGSKAIWSVNDDWSTCTLYFDLTNKDKEIVVTEEDCDTYHGMNAYFDGTYQRND